MRKVLVKMGRSIFRICPNEQLQTHFFDMRLRDNLIRNLFHIFELLFNLKHFADQKTIQ